MPLLHEVRRQRMTHSNAMDTLHRKAAATCWKLAPSFSTSTTSSIHPRRVRLAPEYRSGPPVDRRRQAPAASREVRTTSQAFETCVGGSTSRLPVPQSSPARHPRLVAEFLGQGDPGVPRMQDPIEHQPIIERLAARVAVTTHVRWDQGCDPLPQPVRDLEPGRHLHDLRLSTTSPTNSRSRGHDLRFEGPSKGDQITAIMSRNVRSWRSRHRV